MLAAVMRVKLSRPLGVLRQSLLTIVTASFQRLRWGGLLVVLPLLH